MASASTREMATEESKMEMTPMIDVTFLLLIFFLCTIKFKVLEGKIPAYLPKDVGVNATPIDKQLEKIEIHVYRDPTAVDTNPETNPQWVWNESQIAVKVGPKTVALRDLHDLVKKLKAKSEDAKATIYPHKGTLYIDAVKVVNECLRADFFDITFAGAPRDS